MRCISRSRTPGCSSRSLARAQDFVDVEAQGEEAGAEEDDDDDGLDLPRLSPPPALQSPAPALQSPQPALLSPQPALQSPQPVATPVTPVVAAVEVCAPAPARPQPTSRHRPTDAAMAPAMAAGPARLHAASDAIGGHSRHDVQRELVGRDGVGDTGVRPAHRTARCAQQCARRGLEAEHGRRARAAPLQDVVTKKAEPPCILLCSADLLTYSADISLRSARRFRASPPSALSHSALAQRSRESSVRTTQRLLGEWNWP